MSDYRFCAAIDSENGHICIRQEGHDGEHVDGVSKWKSEVKKIVASLDRKTPFQMVREFHEAFGHPVKDTPGFPSDERRMLRYRLLAEEYDEYNEADTILDLVGMADALADMVYIICGTALEYGIDLDRAFAEVHRSNMAKLGPDGKPIYREDGKILKPEGWTPPDIAGALGVSK